MPNQEKTEILVILDASGSMQGLSQEAASGLNSFIADQAKQPGECVVTLVQFNSLNPYRVIFNRMLAQDTTPVTVESYCCSGMTPMRECICQGIDKLGEALAQMEESDRPGKVIVVIITDGLENASKAEYTQAEVSRRIRCQEGDYSWQFIFLGKNIDSIAEGTQIGVGVSKSADFGDIGKACVLASSKITAYRGSGERSALDFNTGDRVSIR